MNIIEAIKDKNLFRPFIGDDLRSWRNWIIALRCFYGLPIQLKKSKEIIKQCTGRNPKKLPANGFDTALFLTGRRSGKSKISAIIGAYEAAFSGREKYLSAGEDGLVVITAPTKLQGKIVKNYIRSIFSTPLLKQEIQVENRDGFRLRNGVEVWILSGDWRTVRGFTLLAAIIDECCFFGLDADSKIRSDTELIRAIKPGLLTAKGKLIAVSSPYAKKGWSYKQYKNCFGNDSAKTFVWNSPSKVMNPTLDQAEIDAAMAEDRAAALSEYMGQFRDDVSLFLDKNLVESLVVKGRKELLPRSGVQYFAFCDISGGRGDDAALAIAHREGRKCILDCLKRYRPPFSPYEIIGRMCEVLKSYNLRRIRGDNYAAEFAARGFEANGIRYHKSEKTKSQLYIELLPVLCSAEIELLDDEVLVNQLSSLERRTRSGGKDSIDHPAGQHDDLANAVAGVADRTGHTVIRLGGFGYERKHIA